MEENNLETMSWRPFLRQVYICSAETILHFCYGLYFGAPTVFIPQIRMAANSSDVINLEMESWLSASITSYASIPWTIILPIMAYYWGRRAPAILLWLLVLISTVVLFFSTTIMEIVISQTIIGVLPGAIVTVSAMIFTEYTSPKYRGLFLTVKAATFFWGIWIANVIGAFFYWKNIVILMLICCMLSSTIFFWPESPFWLASKGRFEECAKIHRWLNGNDADSERELSSLIKLHKTKLENVNTNKSATEVLLKYVEVLKMKTFYKPTLLAILTALLYILSGKLACSAYAISIIRKITSSEEAAYMGMIILDGFTVFGMYVGCVLSKYFNRRSVLIYTSMIEVVFLFILSLYLYLIKCSVVAENQYVSIILLTIFSTAVSCGPIILGPCIAGELAPIKYRSIYFSLGAIVISILIATSIKVTPFIFEKLGMHVVFLLSALSTSVAITLVYKYLPETKDKTVLEIQRLIVEQGTSESDEEKGEERLYVFRGINNDGAQRSYNFVDGECVK